MKHITQTALALLGAVVVAHVAVGIGTPMPFADGFEAQANGDAPDATYWTTNGAGGVVQVTTASSVELNKSLYFTTNTVTLESASGVGNGGKHTNAWVRMWTKPGIFQAEPAASTVDKVAAAFYVDTDKKLQAYSANAWVEVLDNVPTNGWLGFVVHLDYNTSKWDLYVNTNGVYGDIYTRVDTSPLSFTTNHVGTEMTNVTFDTELPGYIDAVAIGASDSTVIGIPGTGNDYDYVITYDRYDNRPSFAACPPYIYAGIDQKLVGGVGVDLAQNLKNGDACYIMTDDAGAIAATLDSDEGDWGGPATDVVINASSSLWITRGDDVNTAAFYPYITAPTPADDTLYGTDYSGNGWNQKNWPVLKGKAAVATWGPTFEDAAKDDMIWIYREPLWVILKYTGSRWEKLNTSTETNFEFMPGEAFWYYKAATGTGTWNL
ncbi:MAG: hypothetical protein JW951_09850 [Lentisphaerae bacterium]|nr:hypothetical protein [Lentisphaerota bacterium]